MSHTPTKKSVFDRIGSSGGGGGGMSSSSSSTTTTTTATNVSTKSTHGFCNAYIKTGTCPLGDTCKYIHEQPNVDKQQGSKDELRITKTVTRVVDMSSPSIKSTVTVSNEQRPVVITNSTQSTRTVVESVNPTTTEHSERRSSGSDRKQSQSHSSDSKSKSSSKKKSQSSSHDDRHSSHKKTRSNDSDSSVSSPSNSEYSHSSRKHKQKSDSHSTSSKHKKHDSLSPHHNDEETLNDQLMRQSQAYNKSPKRTIVITERKKDENKTTKDTKSKSNPDIEFLGSKKSSRDKKSTETIHQQAESTKKSLEIKREKKSPSKSSISEQSKHHSFSMNTNIQIKTEDVKPPTNKTSSSSERYERSDRTASQSTPPIVQLSPTPELPEKVSITVPNELEKSTPAQVSSPVCVILDDDSIPSPSIEKKHAQQLSTSSSSSGKKANENDRNNSKQTKRSRDSDKSSNKEKTSEHTDAKRKRLNDGNSKKVSSSSKSENDSRSTNNRSESRRSGNISSRDESSSRKYKEKSESKTSRNNDSKDRNSTISSSKSRNNSDRRDTTRSTPDKKRSTYRGGKEKGLENVTDSEEHHDELILPKQNAIEAYMSMDWSSLSRDKRIPLNTQITSRITRIDNANRNLISVCERLLTNEEKEKLNGLELQSSPLTNFMDKLQKISTLEIVNSCHRRFGSCAKDMIDMRHKWFIRSIEPVEQYQFINKEHYMAYQQAINALSDKTSNDVPTVQIETTTADALLS